VSTLNGLPAHALLVHAVVVLVPLTAVLLVLSALWPAARRRLALLTTVLAVFALASVKLAEEAGEWLENHVERTDLLSEHTSVGDTLLPWVGGLFLVAVAVAGRDLLTARRRASGPDHLPGPGTAAATELRPRAAAGRGGVGGVAVIVILAVLALVIGAGAVAVTYRVGESGARAAWTGHFSEQQLWGRRHNP
jgi:hypothetical protein